MSSTSTEDEAPEKRRLQSPEEATGPAQWTVKRPRTGSGTPADINALVASTHELQRSERQTQAISPAPSAGQAAVLGCKIASFMSMHLSLAACFEKKPVPIVIITCRWLGRHSTLTQASQVSDLCKALQLPGQPVFPQPIYPRGWRCFDCFDCFDCFN